MWCRSVFVCLVVFSACHSQASVSTPNPSACAPGPAVLDTIRIALADSVWVQRLAPSRNESEQLVLRQVREGKCPGALSLTAQGVVVTRPGRAVLSFTWAQADARDLLDRGFDVVLTANPRALEYAAARADFDVRPLAWSRTYFFVTKRGGLQTWAEGPSVWRDAIPGDARPVMTPFWWRETRCHDAPRLVEPPPPPAPGQPRMVYLAGDEAARGLAERFVARGVSLEPPGRRERVTPVTAAELYAAVTAGNDYAVVALPRVPSDPCDALDRAGIWDREPREIIPMLDTRLHLIVHKGRFGVVQNGDGIPLFDP